MSKSFDYDKNYDDIRSLITKVKAVKINESFEPGVTVIEPKDSNHLYNNLGEEEIVKTSPEEVGSKQGEEITFDAVNTIGYLSKAEGIELDKDAFQESVGELIKSTGLLLPYVNIRIENGRVIISSDIIKNPSLETVKELVIDTDEEDVRINLVSGALTLSQDLLSLLNSISRSYDDPQIGRNNLIKLTQITETGTEQ
jgi:hypothetical protein